MRAAPAARLLFTIRPIKCLICDVVIPVAIEDAKAPYYPAHMIGYRLDPMGNTQLSEIWLSLAWLLFAYSSVCEFAVAQIRRLFYA